MTSYAFVASKSKNETRLPFDELLTLSIHSFYFFPFEIDIQGGESVTPTPIASSKENQPSRNKPTRNFSASSSQNINDNFKSADFPELDQKTAGNLFTNLDNIKFKSLFEFFFVWFKLTYFQTTTWAQ